MDVQQLQAADVRVGRQGIYDRKRQLVGHELLFRHHGDPGRVWDGDEATSHVINATFGDFGLERISAGLPVFINLTRAFLVGDLPLPFEPDSVVLEILEDVPVDDVLLAALADLRERGYRLAVDDFLAERHRMPLLPLADYVKLDLQAAGASLPDLVATVRREAPEALIVVERVETEDHLALCEALEVDLLQGYVLQRPVLLSAASLSPTQVVCLRLAAALTSGNASAVDVEPLVAADPGLTVRVLRTANSAASAAGTPVRSLRQALVLLGPQQLSAWVLLMLLGGASSTRPEDIVAVLARGHAVSAVVGAADAGAADVGYTVGVLSGVADVLGVDASDLVSRSGVAAEVAAAVLDRTGPCGRALSAVVAHERDDVAGVRDAGIALYDVSRAYLAGLNQAMRTAESLFG